MHLIHGFLMALADSVPGVSGGTIALLMAFGLYLPLISQLSGLLHGKLSALPAVLVFGCSAAFGLLIFVRLLNRALRRYRAHTMFAVLGMLTASLYAVAMGPLTLDVPQAALSIANFQPLWCLAGAALIGGLAFAESKRTGQRCKGKD